MILRVNMFILSVLRYKRQAVVNLSSDGMFLSLFKGVYLPPPLIFNVENNRKDDTNIHRGNRVSNRV